ncbi:molybdate ABC transporter substrate-binding protein [Pseudodesulfovibrio sp.]|uniref:molybdate ABC transporter substrate-binding protein n=1 Tax=Pseudodesulfovibrio sp. TaxID=2035812 RepID=UPI0026367A8E|nr:molybdate ABC transporter substrate-binding protein [Pseudodesulfovibrio sp.]MDD3312773.1 molybdate ABC transporter substrate-binding protein [Pseudodesulfovibrio sp.]
MRLVKPLLFALIVLACCVAAASAEGLVLASGGGYKKMVNALNALYQEKTGRSLDLSYGNMGKVTTLARESGKVGMVLGDRKFLVGKAELSLATEMELGRGKLVLAFAKGSKYSKVSDLDDPKAGRIALPDTSKAIYGKAAREFLTKTGRIPAINPRLVEVATVPQVFAYLSTNEVDMGFLNLTHALNVRDRLGGYVVIDESEYSPIRIIVGVMDSCPDKAAAQAFLSFLETPEAQAVIRANGL